MYLFTHNILPMLGRIFAAIIGGLAIYIALFMYKAEKERWQNRLEQVWIEVDERAKTTDGVFTALVNKVSTGTVKLFNTIFGHDTFSLKLAAVSVNSGFLVAQLYWLSLLFKLSDHLVVYRIPDFHFALLFLCCSVCAICFSSELIDIGCLIPPAAWLFYNYYYSGHTNASSWLRASNSVTQGIVAIVSCFVDMFALIVIRKTLANLQNTSKLLTVWLNIGILFLVGFCAYILPNIIANAMSAHAILYNAFYYLARFDEITCIYCWVPCIALIGLVIHKLMWPMLARFTYPLLDFRIIQERKFLIPIGTLALGIAFGATDSKLFDLLGLFK